MVLAQRNQTRRDDAASAKHWRSQLFPKVELLKGNSAEDGENVPFDERSHPEKRNMVINRATVVGTK